MNTITYATETFLRDELAKATLRVSSLEEANARLLQQSNTNYKAAQTLIEAMQEWTLGELENQDITEEQAEAIANICGFELSKEFELEVTVQYSVTCRARDEESALNLIHDIDFDSVSYPDGVEYISGSVDRIEV